MKKLIIIHGIPGSGKTTIANKLSGDLAMPYIGKDTIKEFLFDELGVRDREWSRQIGGTATDMLYMITEALLKHDGKAIIENAFFYEYSHPRIEKMRDEYDLEILEIYVVADEEVRRQRFIDRNESGERHPGHVDATNYETTEGLAEKYAPLHLGEYLEANTTSFGDNEYKDVLKAVKAFLAK